jgi:hypothetical protein
MRKSKVSKVSHRTIKSSDLKEYNFSLDMQQHNDSKLSDILFRQDQQIKDHLT